MSGSEKYAFLRMEKDVYLKFFIVNYSPVSDKYNSSILLISKLLLSCGLFFFFNLLCFPMITFSHFHSIVKIVS